MAITASIGGSAGGDAFAWEIDYDDATRAVTTVATGSGFCFVTVQVTASITRTVAYFPAAGAVSVKPTLATLMAGADFTVISDGTTQTLASGVNPNQVSRIVGKAGSIGGLPSSSTWSPT